MRDSSELINIGKQLADEYVERGVDLTENLTKVANLQNFNIQQIKRVAETANVETYLKLANLAEDGYVEFKLANADETSKVINKVATDIASTNFDLWEDLPSRHIKEAEDLFTLEKKAEAKPLSFDEVAINLRDLNIAENNAIYNYYELQDKFNNVEYLVKQAMASGDDFPEIKEVLKEASTEYNDLLINLLKDRLEDKLPTKDFKKEATSDHIINRDSEIFKAASEYNSKAIELADSLYQVLNDRLEFNEKVKDTEYKYYIKNAGERWNLVKELAGKYTKSTTEAVKNTASKAKESVKSTASKAKESGKKVIKKLKKEPKPVKEEPKSNTKLVKELIKNNPKTSVALGTAAVAIPMGAKSGRKQLEYEQQRKMIESRGVKR